MLRAELARKGGVPRSGPDAEAQVTSIASQGRKATRSAATPVSDRAITSISRATGTRERSAMARLWTRSAGSRMK